MFRSPEKGLWLVVLKLGHCFQLCPTAVLFASVVCSVYNLASVFWWRVVVSLSSIYFWVLLICCCAHLFTVHVLYFFFLYSRFFFSFAVGSVWVLVLAVFSAFEKHCGFWVFLRSSIWCPCIYLLPQFQLSAPPTRPHLFVSFILFLLPLWFLFCRLRFWGMHLLLYYFNHLHSMVDVRWLRLGLTL